MTTTKTKLFVIGDTHSDITPMSIKNFPEGKDLTKDDVVVQLGDFGVIWKNFPDKEEKYWMNWLAEKPYTTVVVGGNHENWDRIFALPESTFKGAKCWVYETPSGPVYFVKAGEILVINDKKYLCVRGAFSIDVAYRQSGISWWSRETLSAEEETNTLNSLDAANWNVQGVFTHTCPDSVLPAFLDNPNDPKYHDPVSKFLEFVSNKLEFKEWHFGHMHNDRVFTDAASDTYTCHMGFTTGVQEI